jgi:hypothetical protein
MFAVTCINNYTEIIAISSSRSITFLYGKGKSIPLQAWTDPEGSRRLRLPDFKTLGT